MSSFLNHHRASLISLSNGLLRNLLKEARDPDTGHYRYKNQIQIGSYDIRHLLSVSGRHQSLIIREKRKFHGTFIRTHDGQFTVMGIDDTDSRAVDNLINVLLDIQEIDRKERITWVPPENADLTNVVPLFRDDRNRILR